MKVLIKLVAFGLLPVLYLKWFWKKHPKQHVELSINSCSAIGNWLVYYTSGGFGFITVSFAILSTIMTVTILAIPILRRYDGKVN